MDVSKLKFTINVGYYSYVDGNEGGCLAEDVAYDKAVEMLKNLKAKADASEGYYDSMQLLFFVAGEDDKPVKFPDSLLDKHGWLLKDNESEGTEVYAMSRSFASDLPEDVLKVMKDIKKFNDKPVDEKKALKAKIARMETKLAKLKEELSIIK